MHEIHETETVNHPDIVNDQNTTTETTVVQGRAWSVASLAAVAVGAALLIVGIVAMIRADAGTSWTVPIVQVGGLDHTALLGAIEAATGALLVLAGATRSRGTIIAVSTAMVIAGVIVVIEHESLRDDLGVSDAHGWWAIGLGGGLLLVAALVPTRARSTRTHTETTPVAEVHDLRVRDDTDQIADPRWH